MEQLDISLNPCYFGRCTLRVMIARSVLSWSSLNPCYFGRCTLSSSAGMVWTCEDKVSILVILEDVLWGMGSYGVEKSRICLNPCYFGRCTLRRKRREETPHLGGCLNPCYSGRWTLRMVVHQLSLPFKGLNPCYFGRETLRKKIVRMYAGMGLNPCYFGRWTLSCSSDPLRHVRTVLILVILEDGLWEM